MYQSPFLLDTISDSIISTDLDYRIKSWNKAAEEMFGPRAADVLEKPIYEVMGYDFRTDTREIAYQALKTEGRWKGKIRHTGKDGRELYLEINSSTIKGPDGIAVGYVSIYRDITDMQRVEKDLLAEQRRMNDLIQNVPGVVYQWEENYDGRILVVLTDNGQGFDEKAVKRGMGLNNIRNRVEYYKGVMDLRTKPGAGCELRVVLPCCSTVQNL